MFDAQARSALIIRARRDVSEALRFFSRLPAPSRGAPIEAGAGLDMARIAWATPVAKKIAEPRSHRAERE